MIKMYGYAGCDSCRKAIKWLESHERVFESLEIRETPPTESELATMLEFYDGDLKKLFNVSGRDYRELGLKDKLPQMALGEAFALLSANGNLVKRPFVLGEGVGRVGFREEEWEAAFL